MGLFSSVIHLRNVQREAVRPAIDAVLYRNGFQRREQLPVTLSHRESMTGDDVAVPGRPCYLVSDLRGDWLTVIEAHCPVEGAPQTVALARDLGSMMYCYSLALIVHDSDVFFYDLSCSGEHLDAYNSFPPYFGQKRFSQEAVESQRHKPDVLGPLLPPGSSLDTLRTLLNADWWDAYDSDSVDENGMPVDLRGGVAEDDRMTQFGTLLRLHGDAGEYPFAAWRDAKTIDWQGFVALRFSR